MRKIRVGVLFGGRSAEHEISLLSAFNIIAAIPRKKYEVVPIGVSKDGAYFCFSESAYICNPQDAKHVRLATGGVPVTFEFGSRRNIVALKTKQLKKQIDVIFPVVHGTFGEDGTMQGLLALADIPFVGPGVLGSSIGMDKDVTKRLWRDARLPIADFLVGQRGQTCAFAEVKKKLGLPFFVKPAVAGSSVGVHKISRSRQFAAAVEDAFSYSHKILFERQVVGKEIECAVLGNEDPEVSLPGAVIPKQDFYSYKAKYLDEDGAVFEIPARLPKPLIRRIQEIVKKAYRVLELEGMARVDGFLTPRGQVILNEVNTIPGFTKISMYPKLWEVSGLSYEELIDRLLQLAIVRHKRDGRLKTVRA